MTQKKINFLILSVMILVAVHAGNCEHISLKFSLKSSAMGDGNLNTWISSSNSLWEDWTNQNGGTLEGEFNPLSYRSNYDVELRISIAPHVGLNLGMSRLSSEAEGSITHQNLSAVQTQIISNRVSALFLTIGFSYSYPLPFFPRLSVFANGGRQITFITYQSRDNYEGLFTPFGEEYRYWYQKENKYRSESLGYYLGFGVEFEIIQFIALVAEMEKTWSRTDGFKGSHSYKGFLGENEFNEGGKASLYFYESNQWELGRYYSVFSGQKKRPDESYLRNVRQGEFDFGNFSLKIGIRIKI